MSEFNPQLNSNPGSSVRIAESPVLKVRQILQHFASLSSRVLGLEVPHPIPPDEEEPKSDSDTDLSRDASDDELTACLVDGRLRTKETVGPDDVAGAVGEEDKGGRGRPLGVSADVGGGHLEGDNQSADKRGTL